jgi:hypothetical protein
LKCASRRMLLVLKSRWITGGLFSSCRYSKPRAASNAIRNLLAQSKTGGLPALPAFQTAPWCCKKLLNLPHMIDRFSSSRPKRTNTASVPKHMHDGFNSPSE